ncbi:MAG: hypothetical protein U0610_20305 [bacterium]
MSTRPAASPKKDPLSIARRRSSSLHRVYRPRSIKIHGHDPLNCFSQQLFALDNLDHSSLRLVEKALLLLLHHLTQRREGGIRLQPTKRAGVASKRLTDPLGCASLIPGASVSARKLNRGAGEAAAVFARLRSIAIRRFVLSALHRDLRRQYVSSCYLKPTTPVVLQNLMHLAIEIIASSNSDFRRLHESSRASQYVAVRPVVFDLNCEGASAPFRACPLRERGLLRRVHPESRDATYHAGLAASRKDSTAKESLKVS